MSQRLFTSIAIALVFLCSSPCVRADGNNDTQHDYGHIEPYSGSPSLPRPVYFEESWAILSSIGVMNIMFGILVMGIINISPVAIVPIIVSGAGAVANGLCYFAFYGEYSTVSSVAAAVVADIMWLIQEAGMSFYSYLILIKVLHERPRVIFLSLFWGLMAIILILRILIIVSRANDLLNSAIDYQVLVNRLHVGYFTALALVEGVSAFFLLRKFAAARKSSMQASTQPHIFQYLMRSTEVRLATLCIVGITRAITYSWRTSSQNAASVSEQVDRFVYTLECMFPVMMFIDMLGTRSVITNHVLKPRSALSSPSRAARRHSSLGTLSLGGLRPWARPGLSNIASSPQVSPSVETPAEVVEGQQLITGFDFTFSKDTGISRTVDFGPHG